MQQQVKSTKMIDDLVASFKYEPKRARSEKVIRASEFDDEDAMPSASKIRVYFLAHLDSTARIR